MPSDSRDLFVGDGSIGLYKSNIGAIGNGIFSTKAAYLRNVDFGATRYNVTGGNFTNFYTGTASISGTIELVYSATIEYNAYSPNLNFIVHGGNGNIPKRGINSLTIGSSGTVNSITTAYESEAVAGNITLNGNASSISTSGTIEFGSSANVTLNSNYTANIFINNGTVTLSNRTVTNLTNNSSGVVNASNSGGTITNFTNYGTFNIPQGVSYTVASGKSLGGTVTNNGTLTVQGTVTTLSNSGTLTVSGTVSSLTNTGNVNLSGTISTLTNNSSGTINVQSTSAAITTLTNSGNLNIESAASYTVAAGKTVGGTVTNAGTLTVQGTVTNVTGNTGTITVAAASGSTSAGVVTALTNTGTANISGTVTTLTNNSSGTINVKSTSATITTLTNSGKLNIESAASFTVAAGKTVGGTVTI